MSRISRAFTTARNANRAAFIPYLTAGYPSRESFLAHAKTLINHGDILEVGFPYSDPLGDGPTIQKASEQALENGITTQIVFDLIAKLRQGTDKALVLMSYYNPIYCYKTGEAGFLRDLKASGADGIILPDLPPDEGESLIAAARKVNIATVFLVAPTSTLKRLKIVTEASQGFVYAVSVTGVTGARASIPKEVTDLVNRTKSVSNLPVAVGFGIKDAGSASSIAKVADGVVVGSAIINTINSGESLDDFVKEIAKVCSKGNSPL